ncbi:hypothetical protein [Streptosporangium sp. NPDC000396]|uniref:hypothetical protein n=1 Tax=Streptosporangium sp. NPDC000396 TaxID=3366185 RepID=UPI0036BFDB25
MAPSWVVRCADCSWAQTVNEDLHKEAEERLLAWHVAHPDQGFDHLSGRDLGSGLRIPDYVRWSDNGSGLLSLLDRRTGGRYDRYNGECLAIFMSVAATNGLEDAVISSARRRSVGRGRALDDIVLVAAGLYRDGLLQPLIA